MLSNIQKKNQTSHKITCRVIIMAANGNFIHVAMVTDLNQLLMSKSIKINANYEIIYAIHGWLKISIANR